MGGWVGSQRPFFEEVILFLRSILLIIDTFHICVSAFYTRLGAQGLGSPSINTDAQFTFAE